MQAVYPNTSFYCSWSQDCCAVSKGPLFLQKTAQQNFLAMGLRKPTNLTCHMQGNIAMMSRMQLCVLAAEKVKTFSVLLREQK